MISVAEGEKIECFKYEGKYIGQLTLINNLENYVLFKIRTNNNQEIQVTPYLGILKEQTQKISIRCQKNQINGKLQIQYIDVGKQNIANYDTKYIQQLFEKQQQNSQQLRVELITVDQNYHQNSITSSQPLHQSKQGDEQIFSQSQYIYEKKQQSIQYQKQKQQQENSDILDSYRQQDQISNYQQQSYISQNYQLPPKGSNTNFDPPISNSKLIKENTNSEQRYFSQGTFQIQGKQNSISKQSSNSTNQLHHQDYPPRPQSYSTKPIQPQQQQIQNRIQDENKQIQKYNQLILELQNECQTLSQESDEIERQKLILFNKSQQIQNNNQIVVSIQHIFFSALICFLIGYIITN